jgi:hypothetical protein
MACKGSGVQIPLPPRGVGYHQAVPTKNVFVIAILALTLAGLAYTVGRSEGSLTSHSTRSVIILSAASTEFYFGTAGLNCELDSAQAPASQYPTLAYCQSVTPVQSASLKPTGAATLCQGQGCIGNPGLGSPIFPTHSTVILGTAKCLLDREQVRCTRGAHGFVLAVNTVLDRHW